MPKQILLILPKITIRQSDMEMIHGSMCLGHVHKPGDVTAGILLQAKDGRHSFFMDNDGQRKGWTSTVALVTIR